MEKFFQDHLQIVILATSYIMTSYVENNYVTELIVTLS